LSSTTPLNLERARARASLNGWPATEAGQAQDASREQLLTANHAATHAITPHAFCTFPSFPTVTPRPGSFPPASTRNSYRCGGLILSSSAATPYPAGERGPP
jgi:hypothetical protein